MHQLLTTCLLFCLILTSFGYCNEFCDASDREGESCDRARSHFLTEKRYILYDVNPPEGFNLRRDVYMRMAVFARKLRNKNWILVLPPWPHLYHWMSETIPSQSRLPWSLFFNITTMSAFAPVIEMSEFLNTGTRQIEQVYILQHFKDTFTSGNFEDRMALEPCQEELPYESTPNGFLGHFWNYPNLTAKNVDCLSFHGPATQLIDILKKTEAKTVMFDHAEVALHDRFGDKTYWDARRSMKFSDHLIEEAKKFRRDKLNSTDESDKTVWLNKERTALGGNYIAVHMRRRDFLFGRQKEVPSIKGAAHQIQKALKELKLNTVFVATDAPRKEKMELKEYLKGYKMVTYTPSKEIKFNYKDGGVAIIEQIICSNARKFYGTHESTFSFRIQEEREIMGFKPETTFNRLCGDQETNCKPPSKWLVVY
ncbi:hypothetical protein RUM44_009187 [Polyplax serrata]|uniref:GDP-fucose protein O-fucosyltransferase 2 n=1 Tax=Polyplax serrata TaxID=468196 RepID=A0ABR1AS13_POLSC